MTASCGYINGSALRGPDAGWTFAELTERFSRPGSHGTHDAETRMVLKSHTARVREGKDA
jgi:hypothetical protein